jgi:hypothetical protein
MPALNMPDTVKAVNWCVLPSIDGERNTHLQVVLNTDRPVHDVLRVVPHDRGILLEFI